MQIKKNITLSVIIPTKDRFEDIKLCIDSILVQSVIPETVIVVDASERDGLERIIKEKIKTNLFIVISPFLFRC